LALVERLSQMPVEGNPLAVAAALPMITSLAEPKFPQLLFSPALVTLCYGDYADSAVNVGFFEGE
jgi:hypothetical protein